MDFAAISTIIDKTKTIPPNLTSTEFKGDGEKKFLARWKTTTPGILKLRAPGIFWCLKKTGDSDGGDGFLFPVF